MYDLRADTRQFLLLTLRPAKPVLKHNIQKRAGNWARRWRARASRLRQRWGMDSRDPHMSHEELVWQLRQKALDLPLDMVTVGSSVMSPLAGHVFGISASRNHPSKRPKHPCRTYWPALGKDEFRRWVHSLISPYACP
ncbi:hypothetical protein BDP67DRAFT_563150 [Colletotrichum lupini]|nr:hypothetical protein BDP67DRAFT_563150 [Colletotrichum lupini]